MELEKEDDGESLLSSRPNFRMTSKTFIWLPKLSYDFQNLHMTSKTYIWLPKLTYDFQNFHMTSKTFIWLPRLVHLKGIWNEIVGLKETLLYERTFEVIKIYLYSCRVSHISLEIFGFVWYVNNSTAYVTLYNDFLGSQEYLWGWRTRSL